MPYYEMFSATLAALAIGVIIAAALSIFFEE